MPRRSGTLASLASLASIVLAPTSVLADGPVVAGAGADASRRSVAAETPPASRPAPEAHRSSAVDAILVADALVAAGTDPAVAVAQVAALTPEDLAVLAGHPSMVQVAGSNAALTRNLVIGLLVLGAIIALAAASDGGGAVVTN